MEKFPVTSDLKIHSAHTTLEKFENADFFPSVRPPVYTNPSRQRSFSKTLLKLEEFENRRPIISVWTENILKTDLSENDNITIIM